MPSMLEVRVLGRAKADGADAACVDSALAEGGTAAPYGAWELCWRSRQGYGQD
jgi:hypothetical protein